MGVFGDFFGSASLYEILCFSILWHFQFRLSVTAIELIIHKTLYFIPFFHPLQIEIIKIRQKGLFCSVHRNDKVQLWHTSTVKSWPRVMQRYLKIFLLNDLFHMTWIFYIAGFRCLRFQFSQRMRYEGIRPKFIVISSKK